jgi:hypothetical protein
MNYLQLVQRTLRECGISGSLRTVANQQGEMARVVDWVQEAYLMIQNERDWNWLWRRAVANIAVGVQSIDPASEWGVYALRWDETSARLDGNAIAMAYYTHPEPDSQNSAPSVVTIMRDRVLRFNAPMDRERQFQADYYATSEILREDEDTPSMPEQFHMVVVWQAATLYADFEEAGALRMTSQMKLDRVREQMMATEVPPVIMGALA